ncbi:MAG: type IV pilus inner membrane component PilO [Candidatus Latescibacterota bacterium]
MAIEFDIREPKNQRMLAAVMTVAVVFYGYFQFMIKPKQTELRDRKTEIVSLQSRLNSMRGNLQAKKKLQSEKETLEMKLAELESYLPEQENVSVLLDQFTTVENSTKVYVVGFKASETVELTDKPYQANKYKLTIEAGYHQFVEFMASVMALPRILSFTELKIGVNTNAPAGENVNEGLEDQPRSLTIECSITSYVFKDLTQKPADAKGKKI